MRCDLKDDQSQLDEVFEEVFQAKKTACAKALRHARVLQVQGLKGK